MATLLLRGRPNRVWLQNISSAKRSQSSSNSVTKASCQRGDVMSVKTIQKESNSDYHRHCRNAAIMLVALTAASTIYNAYSTIEDYDDIKEQQQHANREIIMSHHYNYLFRTRSSIPYIPRLSSSAATTLCNSTTISISTNPILLNRAITRSKQGSNKQQQQHNNNTNNTDLDSIVSSYSSSSLPVSVRALRGGRFHMEDEYFIGNGGRFAAVFDGHGGGGVSGYLRSALFSAVRKYLSVCSTPVPTVKGWTAALRAAFTEVNTKVLLDEDLKDQGSTAVVVILHQDDEDRSRRTIVSANVGDSRAVLSRDGKAVDLTTDHKPNNKYEYARIKSLGGEIEYDSASGIYRVGDLSLSRAIGDSFAKPMISAEVDISEFNVHENDEFIVLASDGLWDVMSSQMAVTYIRDKLNAPIPEGFQSDDPKMLNMLKAARKRKISKFLAKEAIRRGSMDNICVVIVWLDPDDYDDDLSLRMI